ncbi:MAG TPA: fibronectin type III domain-containing protein [Candidatus Ornithospirochaeta avicola]|uniref:Fibronectin type III domain-containing protein n=1 Tax=Candidatus Ornithospirochaeta avicola TaxID=2840896 RepID=A0A9D1PSX5_9SPIO|nr:fibronectin type III domain-containing protein [Candidatus Ornithospirochaeta avicola]
MRKYLFLIITILFASLLSSCNYSVLSSSVPDYNGSASFNPNAYEVFTGEAPKNVTATQGIYSDYVLVYFDAVKGAEDYNIWASRVLKSEYSEKTNPDELSWLRLAGEIDETDWGYSFRHKFSSNDYNDYVYFYRVVAKSNNFYSSVNLGTPSDVATGWTLSAPSNFTASQGAYTDRINFTWDSSENIKGYEIVYYDETQSSWTTLASGISQTANGYSYMLPKSQYGKEMQFAVRSISSAETSEQSGVRTGYTFVEGAPPAPENLTVSNGHYADKILVSWTKDRNADQGYTYYVKRSTASSSEVEIVSFLSEEITEGASIQKNGREISLNDGVYTLTDTTTADGSPLSPDKAESYLYTVYATYTPKDSEETLVGIASKKEGCLLLPPTNFTVSVNYETKETTITVSPQIGDIEGLKYSLYGRSNSGESKARIALDGGWEWIEDKAATGEDVVFTPIKYNAAKPFHEFYVVAVRGEESSIPSMDMDKAEPIPVDDISIENVSVNVNRFNKNLSANENGVYPVWLSLEEPEAFERVEVVTLEDGETHKYTPSAEIVLSDISPSEPFETVKIKVRLIGVFGQVTEYTEEIDAYGALSSEKYIKLFEAFCLKPWEFRKSDMLPEDVKQKWTSGSGSSVANAVANESTSANFTVPSAYNSGEMTYNVSANIAAMQGDISFSYKNYSEFSDGRMMIVSGSYTMGVGMSGSGSIKRNTDFNVTGMYPALIKISSAYMSVSNKAFSGNYYIQQDNGNDYELIRATVNGGWK